MADPRSVRFASRKWPDSPHWEFDAIRLGEDEHGEWLGVRRGVWQSRPGAGFDAPCDQVMLLRPGAWWVATMYAACRERPVDTYVDVSTPVIWQEETATCVDLDLDVIRGVNGRVWVDDEDEFAEHRRTLAYPDEVIEEALASCRDLVALVTAAEPPFDTETRLRWLDVLSGA